MKNKTNLFILIGLPCSGKDFLAEKIKEECGCEILSSDKIRVELFGYEDQSQNHKVFEEMNKRCKIFLQQGKSVIYNATNLNKKRRKSLVDSLKNYYDNAYAILCLCPLGIIFDRNRNRYERYIPEEKIGLMLKSIDIPLKYEGYQEIFFINTDIISNPEKMSDWMLNIGKNYNQLNEHHNSDVLEHLTITAQKAFEYSGETSLYVAGRFHDIGKPYAREWNQNKMKYTYYGHEKISAYLYLLYYTYSKKIINKLQPIPEEVLKIATLIYYHMAKFSGNLSLVRENIGEELYSKLEILMRADSYRKED